MCLEEMLNVPVLVGAVFDGYVPPPDAGPVHSRMPSNTLPPVCTSYIGGGLLRRRFTSRNVKSVPCSKFVSLAP